MKTVSVRLDEELHRKVVAAAEEEHRSISNLINTILIDYINKREEEQ